MRVFIFWLCSVLCFTGLIGPHAPLGPQGPGGHEMETQRGPRHRLTSIGPTSDPLIHPYFYWPNYGYEKYWADGDWIIRDHKYDLGPNETTTRIPLVCGEECNYMNRKIGQVCGHRANWYRFPGCTSDTCYGKVLKDILYSNYKTFDTYCKFLDQQCRDTDYYRWSLIHRGACIRPQERIFKPLMENKVLVSRAWAYLSTWNKTYEALFSQSTAATARVVVTGRTQRPTTTMTSAKWP